MSAAEWEAWCDATAPSDEPPAFGDDEDEEPDPEPGKWAGGASGFAAGNVLDALPGGGTLAFFAEVAAGNGDRYAGDEVITAETVSLVRAAVQLLPAGQRQVVELAYFKGLTCREVAHAAGIPEGTAKSRLRLAMAKLEEMLDRQLLESS
jgi:RNA polymerase sigma factor (sigma-70 family)